MQQKTLLGHVDECQICADKNLKIILEFGHYPPCQVYLTQNKIHQPEITYPLNLCRCPKCGLAQLDYVGDPKIIFSSIISYGNSEITLLAWE